MCFQMLKYHECLEWAHISFHTILLFSFLCSKPCSNSLTDPGKIVIYVRSINCVQPCLSILSKFPLQTPVETYGLQFLLVTELSFLFFLHGL